MNKSFYWKIVIIFLILSVQINCFAEQDRNDQKDLFRFSPVTLYLKGSRHITTLQIKNVSEKLLTFQLRSLSWTRNADGKDIHRLTNDIIVTPPIFRLNPGEGYSVRIGTKFNDELTVGKAYRLEIQKIESKQSEAVQEDKPFKIKVNFIVVLPIFVDPKPSIDNIDWRFKPSSSDKITISLKNSGNSIAIIKDLKIFMGQKELLPITKRKGALIIFPGGKEKIIVATPVKIPSNKNLSVEYLLVKGLRKNKKTQEVFPVIERSSFDR